jgi:hypothetical protein
MRYPSVLPAEKHRNPDQYSTGQNGNSTEQDSLRNEIEIRMAQGVFLSLLRLAASSASAQAWNSALPSISRPPPAAKLFGLILGSKVLPKP